MFKVGDIVGCNCCNLIGEVKKTSNSGDNYGVLWTGQYEVDVMPGYRLHLLTKGKIVKRQKLDFVVRRASNKPKGK